MRALSTRNDDPKTASRPWDKDRDGFVLGEGAGILVLEDMGFAKARGAAIYAELAGYGMSGDAFHISAPSEDGDGPFRVMRNTLLDAGVNPQRIEVRDLQLSAGGGRASIIGVATQAAAAAPWAVKARAALVDFDPAVWWPGREDAAWRKAVNRLNANGTLALNLPATGAELPLAGWLAAVRGEADFSIADSLLAGVPLTGEASLRSAADGLLVPTVRLDVAGNSVRAQGRLSAVGNGANDALDVSVNASSLERLAPVFALFRTPGRDAQLAGSLNASATSPVAGRCSRPPGSSTPARCGSAASPCRVLRCAGTPAARRAHHSAPR